MAKVKIKKIVLLALVESTCPCCKAGKICMDDEQGNIVCTNCDLCYDMDTEELTGTSPDIACGIIPKRS